MAASMTASQRKCHIAVLRISIGQDPTCKAEKRCAAEPHCASGSWPRQAKRPLVIGPRTWQPSPPVEGARERTWVSRSRLIRRWRESNHHPTRNAGLQRMSEDCGECCFMCVCTNLSTSNYTLIESPKKEIR